MQKEKEYSPSQIRNNDSLSEKVLTIHESLEQSMSLVTAFKASLQGSSGPEVWEEFEKAIHSLSVQTKNGLRLFHPELQLQSTRGLETIGALYTGKRPPHTRMKAFLDVIKEVYGGGLPPTVAVAGSRHLLRYDADTASQLLSETTEFYLNLLPLQADSLNKRLATTVVGEDAMVREAVSLMIRLEVECAVAAGVESRCLSSFQDRIQSLLGENTLRQNEELYRRGSERQRQRQQAKEERLLIQQKRKSEEDRIPTTVKAVTKEADTPPLPTTHRHSPPKVFYRF